MAALVAAAASTAFSSLHVAKLHIKLSRTTHRHLCTLISSSLSPTASTTDPPTEFNITFAPPKPKPRPEPAKILNPNSDHDSADELGDQLFIPWIVRDENGNITLQSTPPARLLRDMANAKTNKKKKKEKDAKIKSSASSTEPKLSKAARRFYNQNFRDPPQRLSKVLAAAGGKN